MNNDNNNNIFYLFNIFAYFTQFPSWQKTSLPIVHLAERRGLPCQDGGSLDTTFDFSRYDPCSSLQIQFSGLNCGAGGGCVSADRLEER